jgi:hypothetical protein
MNPKIPPAIEAKNTINLEGCSLCGTTNKPKVFPRGMKSNGKTASILELKSFVESSHNKMAVKKNMLMPSPIFKPRARIMRNTSVQ